MESENKKKPFNWKLFVLLSILGIIGAFSILPYVDSLLGELLEEEGITQTDLLIPLIIYYIIPYLRLYFEIHDQGIFQNGPSH